MLRALWVWVWVCMWVCDFTTSFSPKFCQNNSVLNARPLTPNLTNFPVFIVLLELHGLQGREGEDAAVS